MFHHRGRMSRRSLLKRSAGAAALATVASSWSRVFGAAESRWFKIGACDWSLGKACDPAAFAVAKQIGLDGVQVSLGNLANDMHLRRADVQRKYREAAQQSGLEIASLAIGEMNQVPLKSDPRAAQWLADSIDVCKALGLTVTMPACFVNGDLDMAKTGEIDHLVGVLKDVAPKAEKQGILIGLENYLSADDNRRILDRVGSPALRVYYDVGNSTDKGRDVCAEIRRLGPLICELHAKDAGHMLGQGRIDFHQVRRALDDIQYSGWIQLEAAAPHGIVPDYTADRKFLKSIFPRNVVA
jgi:L-ribulose-5-phosphate 3-epimerase